MAPPSPDLSGRIALVTGATRGIGRAAALALAKAGAHVIAVGRTQGALEELDDEVRTATGLPATLVPLDLGNGDGVDQLGGQIHQRWGRLDALVGNAAILGLTTPTAHLDPKVWDQVMAINLTANYRLIRSMDPLLRASDAGRAVFVSSAAARYAPAFWAAYSTSKAGLQALAFTYADEVEHTAIRVAVIDPGAVRTGMRARAFPGEDPMTLPPPEAIAPMIVELCAPSSQPPREVLSYADWTPATA